MSLIFNFLTIHLNVKFTVQNMKISHFTIISIIYYTYKYKIYYILFNNTSNTTYHTIYYDMHIILIIISNILYTILL